MTAHEEKRLAMRTHRRRKILQIAVTLIVVVGGVALAETADRGIGPWVMAAATDNPELKSILATYDSPLFIPAADFRTDGLYPEAQSYSVGGYWKGDDLGGVYLMAPVWLPDGAEINSVWLFAVDNDGDCSTADISMWMQRVDNYNGSVDGMAVVSTSGSLGNMQTPHETNPSHPTIEYPDFSYWLTVRVCSTDHELYGAMIFYD